MKTYNKLILSIFGSAFLAGTVSAQNWTVNGATQPLQLTTSSSESAVAIDPLTGVASVRTAGVLPSVTISAAPSSVSVNAATTITWAALNFSGNLNCTRTSTPTLSGWSGNSTLASGSASVTMPSTQQTVTLTLNCTADNGTASNSTNVMVTSGSVDCLSRPPGVLGSPRSVVDQTFASIWNTDFPGLFGPAYGNGAPGIRDGTVIAFSFVAPTNNVISGYLQAVFSPEGGGRGNLASGFSECRGDISNSMPNCDASTGKVRNEWTTTGRPFSCNLIPGRQYYFNLSTQSACVNGPDPGSPGGICTFRLESRRYL